jgi:hypothetical protein
VRDVYALAHAIFYGTDFGRTASHLRFADRAAVSRRLPGLFDRFVRTGQFDILSEIAAVACCIGHPVPHIVWTTLRSAQRRNGTIPFRRQPHALARDVHSTLVAIIAAVLSAADNAPADPADISRRRRRSRPARAPGQSP